MEKIVFRILCAVLCVIASLAANAAPYRCTATNLNIRDTSDKSGKVIGQIAQNETVDILSVDGSWGTILVGSDTGFVRMDYLEQIQLNNDEKQNSNEPWTDKQKMIFWICLVVAVAIYIFAVVKVRQGEMVVIRGWLDFGLLVFPWLTLFALLLFPDLLGKYVIIALIIISILCLLGSLVLSVIANWGSPFYIVFSLVMKIVVIPIIGFGVFYLISKLLDNTGLGRRSIIIFLVLGFLIGGLMSFEE